MSANVVSEEHIRYLLNAGMSRRINLHGFHWDAPDGSVHALHRVETSEKELQRLGQALWDENFKSVNARYRGERGKAPRYVHGRHSDAKPVDPLTVLKLIDGYEYQSNEHDGWEKSEPYAFCHALRLMAIRALDGYNDAPWCL